MSGIDILMITYNKPEYVRLSLPHLLSTCPPDARVWLWHNGMDQETLRVVEELRHHPGVHRFHHSADNVGLRRPTNWMWAESTGDYLGKVDDDCLPATEWLTTLRAAHLAAPQLGAVSCWHFAAEDIDEQLVATKLTDLPGGHRLMRNHWVQGSGYLTRRDVVARVGGIRDNESFTGWCLRAARLGYLNGWYYPFIPEDHMDDPRSPNTIYRTEQDFAARRPLSAAATGVMTLAEWTAQMRHDARIVQTASLDLRHYQGWRARRKRLVRRIRFALFGKAPW